MADFGELHPYFNRQRVDATFELCRVAVFELIYHHKAGERGAPHSVNSDYHLGLELLLERLGQLEFTILGIAVDSRVAQKLEPADRELRLDYPIHLTPSIDFRKLRLSITRAQKPIARRPTAQPGGGNDQKRIRITLTSPRDELSLDRIARALTGKYLRTQ